MICSMDHLTNIDLYPNNFDVNAYSWLLPNSRPIWGTCPGT